MVSGRPFINTTTSGLPVVRSARSSVCWLPGRDSVVRLEASCDIPRDSPTATTMVSACRAVSTASAIISPGERLSCTTSGLSQFRKFR
ncbi:hypothetical protein D3C81_1877390 [compost metagenome]